MDLIIDGFRARGSAQDIGLQEASGRWRKSREESE